MKRALALAGLLTVFCLASAATHAESECENEAGGRFLGQVKPVLYVADVEKSQRFYQEVLGFEFLSWAGDAGAPYYAEMSAADLKFGLHEPTSEKESSRVGKQRLYFRVADATKHREKVISCGGQAGEIKETGWMTMFSVVDLDGNEITFAETDPARHSIDPW